MSRVARGPPGEVCSLGFLERWVGGRVPAALSQITPPELAGLADNFSSIISSQSPAAREEKGVGSEGEAV